MRRRRTNSRHVSFKRDFNESSRESSATFASNFIHDLQNLTSKIKTKKNETSLNRVKKWQKERNSIRLSRAFQDSFHINRTIVCVFLYFFSGVAAHRTFSFASNVSHYAFLDFRSFHLSWERCERCEREVNADCFWHDRVCTCLCDILQLSMALNI